MTPENSNQGKAILELLKGKNELSSLVSKLVQSRNPNEQIRNFKELSQRIDKNQFEVVSNALSKNKSDAENILTLFPDIEIAIQILVSSVLAPKDFTTTELTYSVNFPTVSPGTTNKLLAAIRQKIEDEYEAVEDLKQILDDMLVKTGSHIKAVIPESSLDELINSSNVSLESLTEFGLGKKKQGYGYLGGGISGDTSRTISLEAFSSSAFPAAAKAAFTTSDVESTFTIDISDNYDILRLPELTEAVNKQKVKSILKANRRRKVTGLEAQGDIKLAQLNRSSVYKPPKTEIVDVKRVLRLKETKRKSISKPTVLTLPSESVIPVHVPGNPKKHIGYFVLIDQSGYPLSAVDKKNSMTSIQQSLNTNASGNSTSNLLERARVELYGAECSALNASQAKTIYSTVVESELTARLKSGIYGDNFKLGKNEDVYFLMLARSLANQSTRLLYIPEELVTYFAVKYHENGTGESIFDNLKILASLRAMLLFSKTMAQLKNAISTTHVTLKFDEADPDPQGTAEMAVGEILKTKQQYFPLGINNPVDLVDWIYRSGFEFSFENHPGFPTTGFEFENRRQDHAVPDNEFDENLRKQTLQAIGTTPEMVDNSFSSQFATTDKNKNALFVKRVVLIQAALMNDYTDFIRKLILNDPGFMRELYDITKDDAGIERYIDDSIKALKESEPDEFYELVIEQFLNSLSIGLPRPEGEELDELNSRVTAKEESLDKALEYWISTEFIESNLSGEVSNHVDVIKKTLKAYFMRKFMSEIGYATELGEITEVDEDQKHKFDLYTISKEHVSQVSAGIVKFITALKTQTEKTNKILQEIGFPEGGGDGHEETPQEDSSGGDDAGGGDDEFNFDESADDAVEEPTEEDPNEDEPEEEEKDDDTETDKTEDKSEDSKDDKPEEKEADKDEDKLD